MMGQAIAAAQQWLRESPVLRFAVWFNVGLLVFALVALPFDHRHILGLDPWIKPMKFDISSTIFLVTMAAVLAGLEGWRRSRVVIAWGFAVAMIVEDTIISMQSLRGVRSHMNYATVFDALAFAVMGQFIAMNTVCVAWLLALVSLGRTRWPRTLAWGYRLGLLAVLAASAEGVRMVVLGAHTVGADDGTPGLPFVNWSLGHGDLRAAHFFALHALQAMPLLGWALTKTRWPERGQLAALVGSFVVYMGVVWALFVEAMAGRSVVG